MILKLLRKCTIIIIIVLIAGKSPAAQVDRSLFEGSRADLTHRYQTMLPNESGKSENSLIRISLIKRLINSVTIVKNIKGDKIIENYKGRIDADKLKSYIEEIISTEDRIKLSEERIGIMERKLKQIASLILPAKQNRALETTQLEYALLQRQLINQKDNENSLKKLLSILNSFKQSIIDKCSITKNKLSEFRNRWLRYNEKDYSTQVTKLELLKLKDEDRLSYLSIKTSPGLSEPNPANIFPIEVDVGTIKMAIQRWKLISINENLSHMEDGLTLSSAGLCTKKPDFAEIYKLNALITAGIKTLSEKNKRITDSLILLKKSLTDSRIRLSDNTTASNLLRNFWKTETMLSAKLISTERKIANLKAYQAHLSDLVTLKQGAIKATFASIRNQVKNISIAIINFIVNPLFVYKDFSFSLWNLVKIIIIFIIGWILTILVKLFVRHLSTAFSLKEIHTILIKKILSYTIWLITILIAFNAAGLNTSSFTLIAGALSVGIGFGLQNFAANLMGGVILLFDRSIKIGDYVEAEGVSGRITQINLRKTVVKTNDNIDYIIPNSSFVNQKIINWTYNTDIRRFRIKLSVAYGVNLNVLYDAIIPAIKKLNNIKFPPAPEIWLIDFGDSSLDFEVVFWVHGKATRRPLKTGADARASIYNALTKAKIEIPFPQRVVYIRK